MSDMPYLEAFELLVEKSGWARSEVARDPESAAWFIAQRADTPFEAREAQAAGRIVSSGLANRTKRRRQRWMKSWQSR